MEENKNKSILDLYPVNVNTLVNSGLLDSNKIPTLLEVITNMNKTARHKAKEERGRDYDDKRNIFLQIGASSLWPTSVCKLVMNLSNKHKLK